MVQCIPPPVPLFLSGTKSNYCTRIVLLTDQQTDVGENMSLVEVHCFHLLTVPTPGSYEFVGFECGL